MLTPHATWLEAAHSGAQPRFLLSITTDKVNYWKCLSGYCSSIDEPIAIHNVASVASELDPLTREQQSTECVVEVSDAWLRPILVNNRLKGKMATVTVGFSGVSEANFLAYACGPIEEIAPRGRRDSGVASISIMDLFTVLQKQEITGTWFNKHLLEIMYDHLEPTNGIFGRCGFIGADWVNISTFDPDDATVAAYSHWCTSRIIDFDVYEPTKAFDLVSSISQLLYGQVLSDELGRVSWKRFDSTASSVDTWTVDDIIPGSFEQGPLDENVINQVKIHFGKSPAGTDHPELVFILNDTDSQTAYAYPGTTSRIITHEFTTDWVPTYWATPTADIGAGDVGFTLTAQTHAISGGRASYSLDGLPPKAVAQPASAEIGASRPVYLWLDNELVPGTEAEIVKIETCVPVQSAPCSNVYTTLPAGTITNRFCQPLTFSNVTRGQFGTSPIAHSRTTQTCRTIAWDVSPLVACAQAILTRFKYGCPTINLSVTLAKLPVQLGDFVGLTYPDYLSYGKDGVTSTTLWEVVKKEPDLMSSPPQINIGLAYAGINAHTGGGSYQGHTPRQGRVNAAVGVALAETSTPFIPSGLVGSITGGLVGKVTAGAVAHGGLRGVLPADYSYTFTASKDTYVTINCLEGALTFHEVANGAAPPTKSVYDAWICKFVSNAGALTSVDNTLKTTAPVATAHVQAGAIVEGSLATGAVTENKIGALAVTEGKVGAAAITATKVGQYAIGPYHEHNQQVSGSIIRNPNFSVTSRG